MNTKLPEKAFPERRASKIPFFIDLAVCIIIFCCQFLFCSLLFLLVSLIVNLHVNFETVLLLLLILFSLLLSPLSLSLFWDKSAAVAAILFSSNSGTPYFLDTNLCTRLVLLVTPIDRVNNSSIILLHHLPAWCFRQASCFIFVV